MGCGLSVGTTSEEAKRSRRIGRELRADFSRESKIVKLLLLGAGESGKSTVVKQMKLLYQVNKRQGVGFTAEEKSEAVVAIYDNILDSMVALLDALEQLGLSLGDQEEEDDKFKVLRYAMVVPRTRPPEDVCTALANLWATKSVQECYARKNEFQLNDSAAYFLQDVQKFCSPEFEPSNQDILHTRVKTTGIVKIEFESRGWRFHIFDVGGQRSERKKWIHCFDNVTAVLFVISLSEFDQVLFEDNSTNRMHESLHLFSSILNNIHFQYKPFIVFFNKCDLFEEKISAGKSLRTAFLDFGGPDRDVIAASDFIVNHFVSRSKVSTRQRAIYSHLTTATDTSLVDRVFNSVTSIILDEHLAGIGLN